MATYKIGTVLNPGNDDALKKVAATFEAAMSRAVSKARETARPGHFKVLDLKTRDGQDVIIRQMTPYLFDGMAGKVDEVNALNQSVAAGHRRRNRHRQCRGHA